MFRFGRHQHFRLLDKSAPGFSLLLAHDFTKSENMVQIEELTDSEELSSSPAAAASEPKMSSSPAAAAGEPKTEQLTLQAETTAEQLTQKKLVLVDKPARQH